MLSRPLRPKTRPPPRTCENRGRWAHTRVLWLMDKEVQRNRGTQQQARDLLFLGAGRPPPACCESSSDFDTEKLSDHSIGPQSKLLNSSTHPMMHATAQYAAADRTQGIHVLRCRSSLLSYCQHSPPTSKCVYDTADASGRKAGASFVELVGLMISIRRRALTTGPWSVRTNQIRAYTT